jgi:hypothetical protein
MGRDRENNRGTQKNIHHHRKTLIQISDIEGIEEALGIVFMGIFTRSRIVLGFDRHSHAVREKPTYHSNESEKQ